MHRNVPSIGLHFAVLAPVLEQSAPSSWHSAEYVPSRLVVQFVSPGAHAQCAGIIQNVPNMIGIINNNFFIISP